MIHKELARYPLWAGEEDIQGTPGLRFENSLMLSKKRSSGRKNILGNQVLARIGSAECNGMIRCYEKQYFKLIWGAHWSEGGEFEAKWEEGDFAFEVGAAQGGSEGIDVEKVNATALLPSTKSFVTGSNNVLQLTLENARICLFLTKNDIMGHISGQPPTESFRPVPFKHICRRCHLAYSH